MQPFFGGEATEVADDRRPRLGPSERPPHFRTSVGVRPETACLDSKRDASHWARRIARSLGQILRNKAAAANPPRGTAERVTFEEAEGRRIPLVQALRRPEDESSVSRRTGRQLRAGQHVGFL